MSEAEPSHLRSVRIKLFAGAKQIAGTAEVDVGVPAVATVGQLRAALVAQVPALAGLAGRALFAVDCQFVADTVLLPERGEVALIPPVSGG